MHRCHLAVGVFVRLDNVAVGAAKEPVSSIIRRRCRWIYMRVAFPKDAIVSVVTASDAAVGLTLGGSMRRHSGPCASLRSAREHWVWAREMSGGEQQGEQKLPTTIELPVTCEF